VGCNGCCQRLTSIGEPGRGGVAVATKAGVAVVGVAVASIAGGGDDAGAGGSHTGESNDLKSVQLINFKEQKPRFNKYFEYSGNHKTGCDNG
jgi:hypothetical protein